MILRLEAIWCEGRVPLWRPARRTTLYCAAGPVAESAAIVIVHKGGGRMEALHLAEKLHRWGYRNVKLERVKVEKAARKKPPSEPIQPTGEPHE